MFELVRPEKDATIYGYAENVNTGIDEIIELNTRQCIEGFPAGDYEPSRILIDFPNVEGDFSSIAQDGPNAFGAFGYQTTNRSFQPTAGTGLGPPNAFGFFGEELAPERDFEDPEEPGEEVEQNEASAWLRMWFASGRGMPKKYTIEAFPVEKDWVEGRGRLENRPPTSDPVNWTTRIPEEDWNNPGGDFQSFPRSKEEFDGDDPDVYMNVDALLSEDLEHGILLKREDESLERLSELKFFSLETRTIFVPHLLIGRDDYEFNTENSQPIQKDNFTAYVTGLDHEYHGGPTRFEVTVEEKFEQREFLGIRPTARKESIENRRYLPARSLTWEIKDVRTGTVFFPFDERYSAVSFNGNTHYFDVNLDNLLPKREYEILLKYTDPQTGNEEIFDHHQTFKVE